MRKSRKREMCSIERCGVRESQQVREKDQVPLVLSRQPVNQHPRSVTMPMEYVSAYIIDRHYLIMLL